MIQSTPTDVLDATAWNALNSRQADLAVGDAGAKRYAPDFAPFAALADDSHESFASLASVVPPGDRVALFTPRPVALPDDFPLQATTRAVIEQMVGDETLRPSGNVEIVRLGDADIPEVRALVTLTQPGPFGPRTIEMGAYFGVRVDGALVSMAGERIKPDGWTEVSAVCTHPDWRGRGLARELIGAVTQHMRDRGDRPFLHVFSANTGAIAAYQRMGFHIHQPMHLLVLERPA